MNNVVTLLLILICVVFPIWGHIGLVRNFKNLREDKFATRYEVFIEGIRTKSLPQSLFNVYFLYRRLVTACTLVLLTEYPYFQCVLLLTMSLMNLCYMWGHMPL
jgi:hypothetical protein